MSPRTRNRRGRGLRGRILRMLRRRPPPAPEPEASAGTRAAASSPRRAGRRVLAALRDAFVVTLALAVGVALPMLAMHGWRYLHRSAHFRVEEVVVSGARRVDPERVRAIAGIEAGTHLLEDAVAPMADRLERHPWIARADVRRELPDRIRIDVDERRARGRVLLDRVWLVDRSGRPFVRAPEDAPMRGPVVTGLRAEAFAEGGRAAAEARADVRAATNLARLYREMGLADRWPLSEVRVGRGRRMSLVLAETGTEAVLGEGPHRRRLYRLEWVLKKLEREGEVASYILLDPARVGGEDGKARRVIVGGDVDVTPQARARAAGDFGRPAEPTQPRPSGPAAPSAPTVAPAPPEDDGAPSATSPSSHEAPPPDTPASGSAPSEPAPGVPAPAEPSSAEPARSESAASEPTSTDDPPSSDPSSGSEDAQLREMLPTPGGGAHRDTHRAPRPAPVGGGRSRQTEGRP